MCVCVCVMDLRPAGNSIRAASIRLTSRDEDRRQVERNGAAILPDDPLPAAINRAAIRSRPGRLFLPAILPATLPASSSSSRAAAAAAAAVSSFRWLSSSFLSLAAFITEETIHRRRWVLRVDVERPIHLDRHTDTHTNTLAC